VHLRAAPGPRRPRAGDDLGGVDEEQGGGRREAGCVTCLLAEISTYEPCRLPPPASRIPHPASRIPHPA
jgi:hypothetical protein